MEKKKVMHLTTLQVGDRLKVHCYKHNGKIYRYGSEGIVLDIKKDYIVFGNDNALIVKSDGKVRKTKDAAVLYFFRHKWFNIIAQLKKDGISYYCNIASPYIIEEGAIKYIDYDLDLRIYTNGEYRILDRMEYKQHKKQMQYSEKLDLAVRNGLDELIQLYKHHAIIFSSEENKKYNQLFQELKKTESIAKKNDKKRNIKIAYTYNKGKVEKTKKEF